MVKCGPADLQFRVRDRVGVRVSDGVSGLTKSQPHDRTRPGSTQSTAVRSVFLRSCCTTANN